MKVRNGFVSNSSSSSFIVAFPKKPESLEDVVFALGDCEANPYGTHVSAERVAEIVWRDIQAIEARADEKSADEVEEDEFTREMASKAYSMLYAFQEDVQFKNDPHPTIALVRGLMGHTPTPTKLPREFPEARALEWIKLDEEQSSLWRNEPPYDKQTEEQRASIRKERDEVCEKLHAIEAELTNALKDQWNKHYAGREQYIFNYSDNDSAEMSAMEHGDIFRNLPHERISHH